MTDDDGYGEDPAVAPIERILASAAARSPRPVPIRGRKVVADRAVWLCACVSFEDAPTWLIYDTNDGAFGWCRIPDGEAESDLIAAPILRGDHVDPADVLAWLDDRPPDHGSFKRDALLFTALGRRIRELATNTPHEPR